MSNTEYISISDFAEQAGVSRQAVYNSLDKRLADYVMVIDNKKMLKKEALEIYADKKKSTFTDNLIDNSVKADNDLTEVLKNQLEVKDRQIEAYEKIIADLREQNGKMTDLIEKNNEHIREQETRITTLLEQAQVLNLNNQVLLREKTEKKRKLFGLFPIKSKKEGEVQNMAEFCAECFIKLENGRYTKRDLILSKETDFCEGCAQWKPVVIGIKRKPLFGFRIMDLIDKKKSRGN